ncbi:hypothetical protein Mgra_00003097 [Meloidogyne graminicola]|uniref:Uncharacterized protein n=1 Tax=Meloidogyne graminicola TaxID=189291 RepID=A0A8S9ZWA8_9BILA|nr:hypothetical protein Mgra_00003097 [Meloidogyne graminicola]
MWFEDRSLSNMKLSSLIIEEWRDIWSSKGEFIIVTLAYLFGFTNLLNIPRLILDNGGIAFLIAYLISLLLIILPILLLEISIGQLTGRGPIQTFYNICPVFKGIGISQIIFSIILMAMMTRFLGSIFLYIFHLFWTITDDRSGLPWLNCKNFPEYQFGNCFESSTILPSNISNFSQNRLATFNEDSAFEQFINIIDISSESISQIGKIQINWLIVQCIIWFLIFCSICFGVRWLGKIIMFSLSMSLILLFILFGKTFLLSGSFQLFYDLFNENEWFERLKEWQLWKKAIEQVIIATGLGFGAFCTLGSYNKKSNNLVKDIFFLLIGHIIFVSLQIFFVLSLVGHISNKNGLSPIEIVLQGENQFRQILVYFSFISYTKIFTGIFLFFASLTLLNILFILSFGILATIEDALGEKWSRCCPRFTISLLICCFGAASSIIFATQSGKYIYELASGYLKYSTLMVILFFELVSVAWIYGSHTLGLDIRSMIVSTISWVIGHCLLYINYILTPIPIAIAVINLMGYSFAKYSPQIKSWSWSEWTGIGIAIIPLLPILLWSLMVILKSCNYTPRTPLFMRLSMAFHSPLRNQLIKRNEHQSSTVHHRLMNSGENTNQNTHSSSHGASTGYMLLPQAPLVFNKINHKLNKTLI